MPAARFLEVLHIPNFNPRGSGETGKDFVNMTQKALNVKDNLIKLKSMLVDSKTLKKVKSHKLGEDHFNTHN